MAKISFSEKLKNLLGGKKNFSEDFFEDLTDALIEGDLGYEIKPPKGWTYVDMSNIAAMKSSLPNNISPKMFDRIDVAFFPEYSGDPKQTNLNADRDRQMKNDEALRDDPSISPEELLKPVVKFDNPPSFSPVITIMSVRAKIDQAAEAPKALIMS